MIVPLSRLTVPWVSLLPETAVTTKASLSRSLSLVSKSAAAKTSAVLTPVDGASFPAMGASLVPVTVTLSVAVDEAPWLSVLV
ncbi:hypothetical protein D9M72_344240 [compost metagenome]